MGVREFTITVLEGERAGGKGLYAVKWADEDGEEHLCGIRSGSMDVLNWMRSVEENL